VPPSGQNFVAKRRTNLMIVAVHRMCRRVLLAFFSIGALGGCRTSHEAPSNRFILGCWNLEHERFSVTGDTTVDPGQTTLPTRLQFDTVPGKSWDGRPLGQRVRPVGADSASTNYREGYYLLTGGTKIQVDWTNGFTGLTLELRGDSASLHGKASAWTDYIGQETAIVYLRRTVCPAPR